MPGTGHSLADVGRVTSVAVDGNKASIDIQLGFPASGIHADLVQAVKEAAQTTADIEDVSVTSRHQDRGAWCAAQPETTRKRQEHHCDRVR